MEGGGASYNKITPQCIYSIKVDLRNIQAKVRKLKHLEWDIRENFILTKSFILSEDRHVNQRV